MGACTEVCLGTGDLPDAVPIAPKGGKNPYAHPEGVSMSTGIVQKHAYSVLDCMDWVVPPPALPLLKGKKLGNFIGCC